MSVHFETFPVYPLGCNCSIIYFDSSKEAILVDPGGNESEIQQKIEAGGYTLKYVLHTHAHFDHCLGTAEISDKNPEAKLCLHKGDLFLYENLEMQCRAFGLGGTPRIREISHFLEDGELLKVGAVQSPSVEVLYTPGHTPGSVCFYLEIPGTKILFSGDTLFNGSIGRTDLWGGDSIKIIQSIKSRLFSLDDETVVVPGHGDFTKIYREKKYNPFF